MYVHKSEFEKLMKDYFEVYVKVEQFEQYLWYILFQSHWDICDQ